MVKLPLRSNGALNTALLKKIEVELRCASDKSLAHLPIQQLAWHFYYEVTLVPSCACGQPRAFKGFGKGYSAACTRKCHGQQASRESTMMARHGVKNSFQLVLSKEQSKKTLQKRYGVDHYAQTSMFRSSVNETMQQKHGVDWPMQARTIRDKANITVRAQTPTAKREKRERTLATNQLRYGVDFPTQSPIIKLKASAQRKKTEDTRNPNRLLLVEPSKILTRYAELNNLTVLANELEVSLTYLSRWFRSHGFKVRAASTSSIELEVVDFLRAAGFQPVTNDRKSISPFELDIRVGKLAIEVNGVYWHSYNQVETAGERAKHLDKLLRCQAAGLELLQFTDLEWRNKSQIIKSIIGARLGTSQRLAGRKCKVAEVPEKEARDFLIENHLQGAGPAQIRLGLYHESELVSLMTFATPRFSKLAPLELIRYATKCNMLVVGGAAKLMRHFDKTVGQEVISYSDRMKFSGAIYKQLGFTLIKTNGPGYQYTDKKRMFSRLEFQRHKLTEKLDNFDPTLSEAENCFNHGLRRYWDCGTLVWLRQGLQLNLDTD